MTLVCTTQGRWHLAKHSISHMCLPTVVLLHWITTSGMPRGVPKYLSQQYNFYSGTSTPRAHYFSAHHCRLRPILELGFIELDTSVDTRPVSQIRTSKYWLEAFCFWIRKMKIFPCGRRTSRRKICKDSTFLDKISKLLSVEIVLTESGIRPIMSDIHVLCIFPGI